MTLAGPGSLVVSSPFRQRIGRSDWTKFLLQFGGSLGLFRLHWSSFTFTSRFLSGARNWAGRLPCLSPSYG